MEVQAEMIRKHCAAVQLPEPAMLDEPQGTSGRSVDFRHLDRYSRQAWSLHAMHGWWRPRPIECRILGPIHPQRQAEVPFRGWQPVWFFSLPGESFWK